MQHRVVEMRQWCEQALAPATCRYSPPTDDASFRHYYRVACDDGRHFMLMDSPPDKEDPAPFIKITERLLHCGVRAPRIHHADPRRGFLLIDDFGDTLYLKRLHADNINPLKAQPLYHAAIDTLIKIQAADHNQLPVFDSDTLRQEMHLFTDWLLGKHLSVVPDAETQRVYAVAFQTLIENALAQPQTFVHRDYHSRNLLVIAGDTAPAVIDYQDAVLGPISYDLVSLLKDCYIAWPKESIAGWRDYFLQCYREHHGNNFDDKTFERWFDLMGMQRHFKASGIFARLYHRDGKRGFLKELPRTLGYIVECTTRYVEFAELGERLREVVRRLPEETP